MREGTARRLRGLLLCLVACALGGAPSAEAAPEKFTVRAIHPKPSTSLLLRRAPRPGVASKVEPLAVGVALARGDTLWCDDETILVSIARGVGTTVDLSGGFRIVIHPATSKGFVAVRAGVAVVRTLSPVALEAGAKEGAVLMSTESTRFGAKVTPKTKRVDCYVYDGVVRATWGDPLVPRAARWGAYTRHWGSYEGGFGKEVGAVKSRGLSPRAYGKMLRTSVTLDWAAAKARKADVPPLASVLESAFDVAGYDLAGANAAAPARLRRAQWARDLQLHEEALYQSDEAKRTCAFQTRDELRAFAQLYEAGSLRALGKAMDAVRLRMDALRQLRPGMPGPGAWWHLGDVPLDQALGEALTRHKGPR